MTDQAYRETAGSKVLRTLNNVLSKLGYRLTPDDSRDDVYLHTYDSYEHYKASQVFHNQRKLDNVWADAATLDLVAARVRQASPEGPVRGLCHGARNGFEQRHFNQTRDGGLVVVEHTADHGSGC